MGNMTGVVLETGTAYPSRALGSFPTICAVRVANGLSFLSCVYLLSVSCVPNVASVSGLPIFDCPLVSLTFM